MSIRGARCLVAGACTPFGQQLVEAYLALGAHVIAADALRTQLDALRARLRQHERLWVAECDFGDLRTARKLVTDVARDEPLDTALIVLPDGAGLDPDALAACERFVDVALEVQTRRGHGRILIVDAAGAARGAVRARRQAALWALVAAATPRAEAAGTAAFGVQVDTAVTNALERMIALSDPERPPATGVIALA